MWPFQISETWLCIGVFLGLSCHCWLTDGLCNHPGHFEYEVVEFSRSLENNTYPYGSTATYFCATNFPVKSFMQKTCVSNGTWVWIWGKDRSNCSLPVPDRCQRRFKGELSSTLSTLIFEETCFSLHQGIDLTTLNNMGTNCNIDVFRGFSPHGNSVFHTSEVDKMCDAFLFSREPKEKLRQILFAIKPSNSDVHWLTEFVDFFEKNGSKQYPPKCLNLKCTSHPQHNTLEIKACNISQKYWICKHSISSCGIPSQPENTIMSYSGVYLGDTAAYQCQVGYTTDYTSKRICQSNGIWSGRPPSCKLLNCKQPDLKENVIYELTNGKATYRSQLEHKCNISGQIITNGSKTRRCQANGQWDGHTPTCVWASQMIENNTSNGLYPGEKELLKLIVGVIAGATLFLIALMWLMLAVLQWRDKRKMKLEMLIGQN